MSKVHEIERGVESYRFIITVTANQTIVNENGNAIFTPVSVKTLSALDTTSANID